MGESLFFKDELVGLAPMDFPIASGCKKDVWRTLRSFVIVCPDLPSFATHVFVFSSTISKDSLHPSGRGPVFLGCEEGKEKEDGKSGKRNPPPTPILPKKAGDSPITSDPGIQGKKRSQVEDKQYDVTDGYVQYGRLCGGDERKLLEKMANGDDEELQARNAIIGMYMPFIRSVMRSNNCNDVIEGEVFNEAIEKINKQLDNFSLSKARKNVEKPFAGYATKALAQTIKASIAKWNGKYYMTHNNDIFDSDGDGGDSEEYLDRLDATRMPGADGVGHALFEEEAVRTVRRAMAFCKPLSQKLIALRFGFPPYETEDPVKVRTYDEIVSMLRKEGTQMTAEGVRKHIKEVFAKPEIKAMLEEAEDLRS